MAQELLLMCKAFLRAAEAEDLFALPGSAAATLEDTVVVFKGLSTLIKLPLSS